MAGKMRPVRLALLGAVLAAMTAQTSPAGPSLSETIAWLQASLPTQNYAVDFPLGRTADYRADHAFTSGGCTWSLRHGVWHGSIPRSTEHTGKTVSWLRFGPRAGLAFQQRRMTADEARSFAAAHADHTPGTLLGYVDTIDLSSVRLGSFTVARDVPDTTFHAFIGVNSSDYAFVTAVLPGMVDRYAAAFRHAAILCGAKDDPF
jgi:hypothetical protein